MQGDALIAAPAAANVPVTDAQPEVVAPGQAEELAGPPQIAPVVDPTAGPVAQQERIATIDIVRGAALMGILLMNITSFGGPLEMYWNPLVVGTHRTANLTAWLIRWVFFEGKMRAAFSMLFGAGVILLTERTERRGTNGADIFTRRNMWLVLFGILHCYFIWAGDILYFYGLTALLFLYPCRKLRAKTLLIAGTLVLAAYLPFGIYSTVHGAHVRRAGLAAETLQQSGHALSSQRKDDLKKWQDVLDGRKNDHDDDLKAMRGNFFQATAGRAHEALKVQSTDYYQFGFTDALGMMLIGMGLYRLGFLTGAMSYRVYLWTVLAGFAISIPVNGLEAWGLIRDRFDFDSAWYLLYDAGRLSGALANVALVVMICKAPR